jgi:hypothetical protein
MELTEKNYLKKYIKPYNDSDGVPLIRSREVGKALAQGM